MVVHQRGPHRRVLKTVGHSPKGFINPFMGRFQEAQMETELNLASSLPTRVPVLELYGPQAIKNLTIEADAWIKK